MNWNEIENRCINQKHLYEGENLLEIIKKDEDKMSSYGITFEQLEQLFNNIRQTTSFHNWRQEEPATDDDLVKMCQYIPICYDQHARPEHHRGHSKHSFFDGKIYIITMEWCGSERCPFQLDTDTTYHGYEYGCRDFLFIKREQDECLHIGDLLFHQIIDHHFFQSPLSRYHVDINRLVRFFDLQPHVDYSFKKPEKYGGWGILKWKQDEQTNAIVRGLGGLQYSN